MKRTLLALAAVLLNCTMMFSQTFFDALKVTENDIVGTARYTSMAGAFGALGGDPTSIKDNPAGLGIYRKSEITTTFDAQMQSASSTWNGTSALDNKYSTGFNNFSFIMALPTWRSKNTQTGLLSSNFSFSYNKLKNFNRNVYITSDSVSSSMTNYFAYFTDGIAEADLSKTDTYEPYYNLNIPFMSILAYDGYLINESLTNPGTWESLLFQNEKVIPSYMLSENGSIDEYSMGWSGNFSNKFFFGATLNLHSVYYHGKSTYDEDFGTGGNMSLTNNVYTTGTGVNLNIGTIIVPLDFMRIGLALHTPMFYSLNTINKVSLYSSEAYTAYGNGYVNPDYDSSVDYIVQSPLQLNASTAFILGKKAIISGEYMLKNYNAMRLMNSNSDSHEYINDNNDINNMLNYVNTIKVGAEYRLTQNFALRGGYAIETNITRPTAHKMMIINTTRTDPEFFLHNGTNYITGGIGYREANWYFDIAYVNKQIDESYYAFNSTYMNYKTTPATVKTTCQNIVMTLGLKF